MDINTNMSLQLHFSDEQEPVITVHTLDAMPVSITGQLSSARSVGVTIRNNNEYVSQVTSNGSGAYSYSIASLPAGLHNFSIQVNDVPDLIPGAPVYVTIQRALSDRYIQTQSLLPY